MNKQWLYKFGLGTEVKRAPCKFCWLCLLFLLNNFNCIFTQNSSLIFIFLTPLFEDSNHYHIIPLPCIALRCAVLCCVVLCCVVLCCVVSCRVVAISGDLGQISLIAMRLLVTISLIAM